MSVRAPLRLWGNEGEMWGYHYGLEKGRFSVVLHGDNCLGLVKGLLGVISQGLCHSNVSSW